MSTSVRDARGKISKKWTGHLLLENRTYADGGLSGAFSSGLREKKSQPRTSSSFCIPGSEEAQPRMMNRFGPDLHPIPVNAPGLRV